MSTKQQFSLRWTNYLRHVTTAFDKLRCMDDLVDVTLCCEGRKIKAHKMLLSACSTYFKEIFLENPCQHPVIIFRNVRYDDLCAIINFMYQGEVNVAHDQLASFLTTAELLEVQGLTDSSETDQENFTEVSIGKTEAQQPMPQAKRHKPNLKKQTDSDSETSIDQNSDIDPINIDLTQHSNFKEEIADDDNLEDANMDIPDNIAPGPSATSFPEEIEICESDAFQATNVLDDLKTSDVNNSQSNINIDLTQELIVDGASREIPQDGDLVKFRCQLCWKGFKHPTSLTLHKDSHTGKTQCPVCHRSFSRSYDMRSHLMKIHQPSTETRTRITKSSLGNNT